MATEMRSNASGIYVRPDKGLVDRRIFSDPDIFQREMEQIFARSWNFMCHESQIPNPGDFFLNFIGEDRVIVVRNNDGGVSVLVNSCRHRGNAVCRADEGHATSFMCTYHGWTYDLTGALVGVPGFKEVYHEELDREHWGLITAAQVDSYKGLVFANMDAEAPGLSEWLGDATIGLDALMDRGDVEAIGGVSKYIINCNWKFAQDNSNDTYHGSITHAAARMLAGYMGPEYLAGRRPQRNVEPRSRYTFLTEYGHTFVSSVLKPGGKWPRVHLETQAMEEWRNKLSAERPVTGEMQLNSLLLNLFPNAFVSSMTNNLELRIPRGPLQTEVWMWTFVDKNAPQDARSGFKYASEHHFGPGGIHEQDDGENWGESTNGTRGLVSRRYPLNYSLNLGHGEIIEDEEGPPRIENSVNEHGQLWLYRKWAEMMDSPTWADYKRIHARPQGTV